MYSLPSLEFNTKILKILPDLSTSHSSVTRVKTELAALMENGATVRNPSLVEDEDLPLKRKRGRPRKQREDVTPIKKKVRKRRTEDKENNFVVKSDSVSIICMFFLHTIFWALKGVIYTDKHKL